MFSTSRRSICCISIRSTYVTIVAPCHTFYLYLTESLGALLFNLMAINIFFKIKQPLVNGLGGRFNTNKIWRIWILFFFNDMRLLLKLQLILHESITDMYNHIYILRLVDINADIAPLRFLTLSNIRGTPNSHPGRKTAFTQVLELQGMTFKLNPYNASVETRTTSLTFVREWL